MRKTYLAMVVCFISTLVRAESMCQTSAEIKNHLETKQTEPEFFCFHRVMDPSKGITYGEIIPRFNRLRRGMLLAFLNTQKSFDDSLFSCRFLGQDWHTPKSNFLTASPRAESNEGSLEAIGEYLRGSSQVSIWSSSRTAFRFDYAWLVRLHDGTPDFDIKYVTLSSVCVN